MFHRDIYPSIVSISSYCARYRAARLVLSFTSPTSCPQAASISSPRVVRTVTMNPASIKTFQNRDTALPLGRLKPDWGKSLNGMRLILQGKPSSSCASSERAPLDHLHPLIRCTRWLRPVFYPSARQCRHVPRTTNLQWGIAYWWE